MIVFRGRDTRVVSAQIADAFLDPQPLLAVVSLKAIGVFGAEGAVAPALLREMIGNDRGTG